MQLNDAVVGALQPLALNTPLATNYRTDDRCTFELGGGVGDVTRDRHTAFKAKRLKVKKITQRMAAERRNSSTLILSTSNSTSYQSKRNLQLSSV